MVSSKSYNNIVGYFHDLPVQFPHRIGQIIDGGKARLEYSKCKAKEMFAAIVVRIERRYIKRQAHSGGLDEISVGINII